MSYTLITYKTGCSLERIPEKIQFSLHKSGSLKGWRCNHWEAEPKYMNEKAFKKKIKASWDIKGTEDKLCNTTGKVVY